MAEQRSESKLVQALDAIGRRGFAFAFQMLGNRDDALDAVQSSLTSIWQGRERIDPNTAPAESLRRLPGIGPALAGAIIAHREAATSAGKARAFRSADDLVRVRRIGPVTLERLRPFVAIAAAPPGR